MDKSLPSMILSYIHPLTSSLLLGPQGWNTWRAEGSPVTETHKNQLTSDQGDPRAQVSSRDECGLQNSKRRGPCAKMLSPMGVVFFPDVANLPRTGRPEGKEEWRRKCGCTRQS